MYRFIILIMAVALFMGCDSDDSGDNGPDEYFLEDVEFRGWSAIGINEMTAETVNGEITYYAIFADTIIAEITRSCTGVDQNEAEACIDSIVVTDNTSSDHLYLTADMPGNGDHNYRADFNLSGPGSIYTDLGTVNGTIILNSMLAGANLHTVNGSITVENLQGSLIGQSVNGSIDCEYDSLTANDSVILQVSNGSIILSLLPDVSATFDASTVNGTVTVAGFSNVSYTTNELKHKAGTFGSGDANIVLSIVNGTIIIRAQ